MLLDRSQISYKLSAHESHCPMYSGYSSMTVSSSSFRILNPGPIRKITLTPAPTFESR